MLPNKTFCVLPWVHLYIHTDGDVYPCCTSQSGTTQARIGTVGSSSSLEDMFNSPFQRQLRLDMIEGVERPDVCNKCYVKEESGFTNTPRLHAAQSRSENVDDLITNTSPIGFVDPKIKSWNFRLSNICNLKCRICSAASSSAIASEQKRKVIKIESNFKNSNYLDKQLLEVDDILWAGGEPLLMKEHYDILNKLIEIDRAKYVTLQYNSNVTQLTYKNVDILTLWPKFKQVSLSASIDAYGARADYLRHGVAWGVVENNLRLLLDFQKNQPTFSLSYPVTVSIHNIWHLPDLHNYLSENGFLVGENAFNFAPLMLPKHQSINILPRDIKDSIISRLTNQMTKLNSNYFTELYSALINFLNTPGDETLLSKFKYETTRIDRLRNENFLLTFPEHIPLFNI